MAKSLRSMGAPVSQRGRHCFGCVSNQEWNATACRVRSQRHLISTVHRLLQLRADTEREHGATFDPPFHDFILSQGLLPPALLRKAVVADFIASACHYKSLSDRICFTTRDLIRGLRL